MLVILPKDAKYSKHCRRSARNAKGDGVSEHTPDQAPRESPHPVGANVLCFTDAASLTVIIRRLRRYKG